MTPRRSSCRTSSCRRGGAGREGLASACRHSGGATVVSQRSPRLGGVPMHTYKGDKFFVVDGHVHFWDASPANWVSGQEQYAKGWIECFHAYMGLGPEETHWPIEKFQKYSEEDFVKDVFEDGHVDAAIFQSTYLKEWYRDGFNTLESNARLVEKYPDRLIANGRWDPREGEAGMKQLEEDAKRYGLKGVKLYTAEWYQGSRGWSLKDAESQRFLEKCQELGIKNIHVHKGPTIWPLDKDAFDVSDVDLVATNFPELNFVVEHLGLNAAKLYGIDVPEELRLPDEEGTPAAKEDAQLVSDKT